MGYESRIYVVNKTSLAENDGKKYAQLIARFDMSKMGGFDDLFKKETDCYVFADDGNTKIETDAYGDRLKEASVEDVIEYLDTFEKTQDYYRRIHPLLGCLQSFNPSDWEGLVVLHYGY